MEERYCYDWWTSKNSEKGLLNKCKNCKIKYVWIKRVVLFFENSFIWMFDFLTLVNVSPIQVSYTKL